MDFMKGIDMLVKVDEMYNILKTLLATRYWSRDEGGIGGSEFWLSSLQCPYVYYVPALLGGKFHLFTMISYYFLFIEFRLSI